MAAWDMVCHPKTHGVLGVINLQVESDALLMKYVHKFYNRMDLPNLIWSTYYAAKIPHVVDPCGSFWWLDIMNLSPVF